MSSSGHFNPVNGDVELRDTYEDRVIVKSLGAKYDGVRRVWFVPSGMDLAPFSKWLPIKRLYEPVQLKSPCIYLAFATYAAHPCGKPTTVGGFGIPFDSKSVLDAQEKGVEDVSEWINVATTSPDMLAIVPRLDCVPKEMRDVLEERCGYRPVYSMVHKTTRLRNVCTNCKNLVGDNYAFHEFGAPLGPMSVEEVDEIEFLRFDLGPDCEIFCSIDILETGNPMGHPLMVKAFTSAARYRRKLYEMIYVGRLLD